MAAPVVLDTNPADGAVDVAINTSVVFTLSEDIDISSVTPESVLLFDLDTLEEVVAQRVVSGKTITIVPRQAFFENRTFRAALVGSSSGSSETVKSGGDALADDFSFDFRTGRERFVPLSEVTTRDDVDAVAPIRAVENLLLTRQIGAEEPLRLLTAKPRSFTSQIDPCLTQFRFTFNKPPTGVLLDEFIELEVNPVLDIPEYVADVDGDGNIFLKDCAPTGVVNGVTPPDFGTPTGTFSIDGDAVLWDRGPSEPCFNLNEEVMFTFLQGLLAASGQGQLEADVTVVYTTTFFPLFAGVRYLRLELGPVGKAFQDDTISRVIHKNSIEAWEEAGRRFDVNAPFPVVRRYTVNKTLLDLIDMFALERQAVGSQSKRLGDFSIQDDPRVLNKYKNAQEEVKRALRELRYFRGQGRPGWVIKGAAGYNTRCDLFERTWDNLGWWSGHQIPIANHEIHRHSKEHLSGDHLHPGCAPTRLILGKNGGLFSCTPPS